MSIWSLWAMRQTKILDIFVVSLWVDKWTHSCWQLKKKKIIHTLNIHHMQSRCHAKLCKWNKVNCSVLYMNALDSHVVPFNKWQCRPPNLCKRYFKDINHDSRSCVIFCHMVIVIISNDCEYDGTLIKLSYFTKFRGNHKTVSFKHD